MFGYVRVEKRELRLREYECYRALYCGLCHRMGKCTGQCSRMTLCYDFVLLAAVRMSLSEERFRIEQKRCFLHPLHKRAVAVDAPTLDYCADASALLAYHKLADDCLDERGPRRLIARMGRLLMRSGYRRARRRHPELDATIRDSLDRLQAVERDPEARGHADLPAACFGDLMAEVCASGLAGRARRIAERLGQSLGRWIYYLDAADDYGEDQRRGRYNPYLAGVESESTFPDWEAVRVAMNATLADCERAFLLIDRYPAPELKEIIYNVFYLGLPGTAERVLEKAPRDGNDQRKDTSEDEESL